MLPPGVGSTASHPPVQLQYDTDGQLLLTPSQQKALDKQREWEGFTKILRQTEQLNQYFVELAGKTELMEDGGRTMAKVLENWQNVFRATHIALASMANRQSSGQEDVEAPTLVRMPTSSKAAPREEAGTPTSG